MSKELFYFFNDSWYVKSGDSSYKAHINSNGQIDNLTLVHGKGTFDTNVINNLKQSMQKALAPDLKKEPLSWRHEDTYSKNPYDGVMGNSSEYHNSGSDAEQSDF